MKRRGSSTFHWRRGISCRISKAFRSYLAVGGLASYGRDWIDEHELAAGTSIACSKAPARRMINLKTANTLGLTVPPSLLSRIEMLFAALH